MKVLLRSDVQGVGRRGDIVDVNPGYARNFLLPTGAVVVADKGAVANWERHRDQREERDRSARARGDCGPVREAFPTKCCALPPRKALSGLPPTRGSWAARCAWASRATATGSPTPLPGCGANTGTPARSP